MVWILLHDLLNIIGADHVEVAPGIDLRFIGLIMIGQGSEISAQGIGLLLKECGFMGFDLLFVLNPDLHLLDELFPGEEIFLRNLLSIALADELIHVFLNRFADGLIAFDVCS